MKVKVSDLVIKFLESKGISHVFTVSGGGCIHLIDSLGRSDLIDFVCTHHEQSAAIAAEGFSRIKNQTGACIVTTGPGGTNALTGVLGAWLDSIPVIIISGQVSLNQTSLNSKCRQIGDQEFNIVDCVKSMTKYAVMVKDKNDVLFELEKAYEICNSGRKGPVWIDIPLDIQGSTVDDKKIKKYTTKKKREASIVKQISRFKNLLNNSLKPVVLCGGGVSLSGSSKLLKDFLQKNNIPALTTVHSAVDCIDNTYKYYAGRIGILGNISSNKIVQECDLLIILGSRLTVKATGYNVKAFSPKSKKVYVDIDLNEIEKHEFDVDLTFNCDLRLFLNKVKDLNLDLNIQDWRKRVSKLRQEQIYVYPKHKNISNYCSSYFFIKKLEKYCGSKTIVTSNGTAHVVTLQTLLLKKNQRMFTNVGCASMGYGLPAAIGSYFASKKPLICIEGDGSLMMNLQDLQTVKQHNIPVLIIIINNDGYSSIKITQKSFFKGFEVASGKESGITFPNYKKVAKAFDLKYISIKNNNQIEKKLNRIFLQEISHPVICEVFTHPLEKHEPKVIAKGIDSNGKIIPGDLCDMYISETIE